MWSIVASPMSCTRPAESGSYSCTVPPGSGRSPKAVPRTRLSVYHTCTGTRFGSTGTWPSQPRQGSTPGTTNSFVTATLARGKIAVATGTPGSSARRPGSS
ncbi:MAG: hypothetical protein DMD71_01375 [Gemmatimonadetes bacterium]|nr:MAG: hypothetical protein DMD74_07705 [Gemmatimonadota bacterium]PYO70631.1 MAG: hypothetical protein DMD71_01375 [Gemmatimonadota bacterium]